MSKHIGPYMVLEDDSEIVEKDKSGRLESWVILSGDNPENLTATFFIEHRASRSIEQWIIKGVYSVDDGSKLGRLSGVSPDMDYGDSSFTVSLKASGPKAIKLYQSVEKFFKGRIKKDNKQSRVNL